VGCLPTGADGNVYSLAYGQSKWQCLTWNSMGCRILVDGKGVTDISSSIYAQESLKWAALILK
jgi:hypothetical protein